MKCHRPKVVEILEVLTVDTWYEHPKTVLCVCVAHLVTELSTRMEEEKEAVREKGKTLERVHDVYEIDMYG